MTEKEITWKIWNELAKVGIFNTKDYSKLGEKKP